MYQRIPEDKYKSERIGEHVIATGYKSTALTSVFKDGEPQEQVDLNYSSLSIKTDAWTGATFELHIRGRKNLLQLREIIDFALEVEEDATD